MQTNLDLETFDILSYKVEQQPAQTKAKKNVTVLWNFKYSTLSIEASHHTSGRGIIWGKWRHMDS